MLPPINRLSADQGGWGFFLCTEKSLRSGRGGDFLALTLRDGSGTLIGRIFDNLERFNGEFEAGEFVKAQGRTNLFNGRLQFVIENIRRVMVGPDSQDRREGFREELLLPVSPRPLDEMWAELQQVVASVGSPQVRTLLERIITKTEERLRIWPAARAVHHAYRGGFLEHVLKMARAGRVLANEYDANADLVVAGALLHDIGKLEELDYAPTTSYTREGNLVGHVTLGVLMVRDACDAIPGFPDALRTEITHLILSHHGDRQYGAPVEPMTIEAMILASIDDLDSKINQVRQALAEDAGEGEFTAYNSRLGRSFWKGPGK